MSDVKAGSETGIPADVMEAARDVSRRLTLEVDDDGRPYMPTDDIEEIARAIMAERERNRWQPMETAPLDGKHCILAIPSGSGFIYSIQGAYMHREWHNAADIKVEPLAWMPNILLPDEYCPWTDAFKARQFTPTKGAQDDR